MTIQNGTYTLPYDRPMGMWTLTVATLEHGQVYVLESDHTYPEEISAEKAREFIATPGTVQS
ncbi:hypothetical protein [Deinococcus soli (ex Cha et al. 2016)]|uniref:hypothetical protein n=1 Tax=Deinococcus soli (ex Cha et al. 2016) TaxID=1309411 RepID=UPI001663BFEF|nr:hypothetical protein [Deinococcus soli (ex Cha et al. 2016)]GGB79548.1 hypothetical protein GCM10008019_39730 [Deinococcus soli (ex Cha et al. 2016)]